MEDPTGHGASHGYRGVPIRDVKRRPPLGERGCRMNASGAFGHVSTREPLGDLILRMPGGTPGGAKMATIVQTADPPAGRASSSGYTATVKTRGALALLLPHGDVNTDQKEVTPPTGGDPYIRLWVQPGLKPPKFGRRPRATAASCKAIRYDTISPIGPGGRSCCRKPGKMTLA